MSKPHRFYCLTVPSTFAAILGVTIVLLCPSAHAQRILHATPDTYRQQLPKLQPGDVLRLAPGEYNRGMPLRSLAGRKDAPIIITGPEAGPPAILIGRDGSITVSLIDVAHVTLRHLTLDGRGARAHGLVAEGRGRFAHHVTLEHLTITGFNAAQDFNGISTKTPAWGWVIRNNHIDNNGTGLYLGNSDGRAPFVAGLIEGNTIENTLGYNMQIKHQMPRPDLPGLPSIAQTTVIRHNIFDKSSGGSTGARARPNLLLGHWPLEGPGRDDRYLVHDNLFYQNPTARLFQAEGHVTAYNNTFINIHRQAVSFQPHNDVPRDIQFHRNTVIGRGPAITITGADPTHTQQAVANLIYSEAPPVGVSATDNRIADLESITTELRGAIRPRETLDLTPIQSFTGAPPIPEAALALPGNHPNPATVMRNTQTFGAIAR